MENKNVVLIDFKQNEHWDFFDGLNQDSSWDVMEKVTNNLHHGKISNLRRYLKYYNFAFKIFIHRKRYKNVVAWQQFFGIFLCYFLRFFHSKASINIYIANFLYKEKKGIKGRIYKNFISKALKCKQLKKICVLSTFEIDYLSKHLNIDKSKIFLQRQGIDKVQQFDIKDDGYFISVGRSNRDYDFLVDCFKKMPEYKLMIISDNYTHSDCPSNISINNNCYGEESDKLIASSRAVIISLTDIPVSSGILVVNTAFLYKKPCIVTRNLGVIDYVSDKENAIIIDKNKEELKKAIETIQNDIIYSKMVKKCVPPSMFECGKSLYNMMEGNENV